MRRCILLLLCLLASLTASANPVQIDGTSLLAFCIVAFWAFVVEAGIVALLLAFRGLAPLRAFAAYFIGNALIFFFVFQPLLGREWLPIPVLELLVVLIDTLMIRFLVSLEVLQGDAYAGVSWLRAILVSGCGNAASYFVGYLASRKPWEVG